MFYCTICHGQKGWPRLELVPTTNMLYQLALNVYVKPYFPFQFLPILFCCRPVHGLIFLFKWVPDKEPEGSIVKDSRLEKIFFAKQVWLYSAIIGIFGNSSRGC